MHGDKQTSASNRTLVLRFAGYLAHLLNDPTAAGEIELKAFAIYRKIMAALEARELVGEDGRYDALVGRKLLGPSVSPEQAAETYFDQVLKRPLHLARDGHWHKGHELLLALCRRGISPHWHSAQLSRSGEIGNSVGAANPPLDIRGVFERLSKLEPGLSSGNPACSTRAAHGPLYLRVGGCTTEIAEEMSVWDAICCAPLQLTLLGGPAFQAFCSAMIKAVETANAHYGALLSLGLSPLDWRDLSLNTAKKTSTFLSGARDHSRRTGRPAQDLTVWQEVWEAHRVPGYSSASDFWNSELGQALRCPQVPVWAADGTAVDVSVASGEEKVLDVVSFERMVALAEKAGVIRPCDGRMLIDLFLESRTAEQIAMSPDAHDLLGQITPSRRAVIEHLRRLANRVRAHSERPRTQLRLCGQPDFIPMLVDGRPSAERP
jgi:hypothetical protein